LDCTWTVPIVDQHHNGEPVSRVGPSRRKPTHDIGLNPASNCRGVPRIWKSHGETDCTAGVPHPIVKQLLNHAGSDVTEKHYTPDDPMLEFMCEQQEKISRYIVARPKAA